MPRITPFSVVRIVLGALPLLCLAGVSPSQSPLIEQRLADLRTNPTVPSLPEIPNDLSPVPDDWLALVSWNIQVGATSVAPGAPRPPMVSQALTSMLAGSYRIVAAQEIPNVQQAGVFTSLLPAPSDQWAAHFIDTSGVQDNGFWTRPSVATIDHRALFLSSDTDSNGRPVVDGSLTTHPPQAAHFTVGDIDFTLITVHLTFAGGDTAESAREMRVILDYLDHYFSQPNHDPDVIIAGDFNIPTRLSGQTGRHGITLDDILDDDPRFQVGARRLVATVHEPTSRRTVAFGGVPNNNYDHFIFSARALQSLIQARRLDPGVLTNHPNDPAVRLTSDHFPIVAFMRTQGPDLRRDLEDAAPTISSVVKGASFKPGISSGAWITIFGRNLASNTRIWRDDEIVDGALPDQLDDVRVLVNGKPASVYFISPNQINVQAPDDPALGPVTVEVIRGDAVHALASADAGAVSPALFPFDPEGRKYAAAVHPDGTFVGKPDLFDGAVVMRPAKPGDVVLLFGTGFGATDPTVPSGEVFVGAAGTVEPVHVTVGGVSAEVSFAGLVGAGLHQLNVVIPPSLPSGDLEVLARTAGVTTQAGVFVTVEADPAPPVSPPIVISQIYGGGGNQGATLTNDFVELFNRGSTPVSIDGWTLQYAAAASGNWSRAPLSGVIQAGGYHLVRLHQGAGGTTALPAADSDDGSINISAASGKIAIVISADALSGAAPNAPEIVDLVGYGAATFSWGSPAPLLNSSTAALRNGGGCADSRDNKRDFERGAPDPRNSASPRRPCP